MKPRSHRVTEARDATPLRAQRQNPREQLEMQPQLCVPVTLWPTNAVSSVSSVAKIQAID
jgi:hypothetical protein